MSLVKRLSVALVAIALVSCSLKLEVVLFNNADETVTVRAANENIVINQRESKQFAYPGEGQRWVLRLSTARCDYEYAVPKTLEHYPWQSDSKNVLKVQVERDFSLHLLPPNADGIAAVTGLAALQQDGFPLHPVARNCH